MSLANRVADIKREFVSTYKGNSYLYEIVPSNSSGQFFINSDELEALHRFAENNPIYSRSFKTNVLGDDCIVYEGDSSGHWLDSIKHDTSYAPFYPTWILSAYILAREAKNFGALEAVDIGSGDGRIAYCCRLLGMRSYGIEIDDGLVRLQNNIVRKTRIEFEPITSDATRFDYLALDLKRPVFFIGGLPEVGEMLAKSVIEKITSSELAKTAMFVLAGVSTQGKDSRYNIRWGWDKVIREFELEVVACLRLPTRWTVDQPTDTPYVFVFKSDSNRQKQDATFAQIS